jgi:hypothetical protein
MLPEPCAPTFLDTLLLKYLVELACAWLLLLRHMQHLIASKQEWEVAANNFFTGVLTAIKPGHCASLLEEMCRMQTALVCM